MSLKPKPKKVKSKSAPKQKADKKEIKPSRHNNPDFLQGLLGYQRDALRSLQKEVGGSLETVEWGPFFNSLEITLHEPGQGTQHYLVFPTNSDARLVARDSLLDMLKHPAKYDPLDWALIRKHLPNMQTHGIDTSSADILVEKYGYIGIIVGSAPIFLRPEHHRVIPLSTGGIAVSFK